MWITYQCAFDFAARLFLSPSHFRFRSHRLHCAKHIHVTQQCANNNHVNSICISLSLQKWDFYVLKIFQSLEWFIDIEIRCGIFLFLHLFHWHLNQVIQINRTDRNSDSIQLWMFAICDWSFQCLRWRLWHGNFIPNNCWQNCTTNPNQTQPNPIDIIYIYIHIHIFGI